MTKKYQGGILNPFVLEKAHFDYEVVEDKNEVRTVSYEDYDGTHSYPEKDVLIRSLSGGGFFDNQWLVSLIHDDALKVLRPGEIISLNLSYYVNKDEKGNFVQKVKGDNLYTMNDYFQVRDAESFYHGSKSNKKKNSDK